MSKKIILFIFIITFSSACKSKYLNLEKSHLNDMNLNGSIKTIKTFNNDSILFMQEKFNPSGYMTKMDLVQPGIEIFYHYENGILQKQTGVYQKEYEYLISQYKYDKKGRIEELIGTEGNSKTKYEYNNRDRLIKSTTNRNIGDTLCSLFEYKKDVLRILDCKTKALKETRIFKKRRLIKQKEEDVLTEYKYNKNGEIIYFAINPINQVQTYTTSEYTYDKKRNWIIQVSTDEKGNVRKTYRQIEYYE